MTTARLTKKLKKAQQGFTLIELLVVIGILAVLLAIVLIAINPARQFAQANNTQRASNVNAILNAIHEYAADNKGALPAGIPVSPAAAADISHAGVDLCAALVTRYLAAMPVDPGGSNGSAGSYTDCNTYDTKYTVVQSSTDNRITVAAPQTELGAQTISVTR